MVDAIAWVLALGTMFLMVYIPYRILRWMWRGLRGTHVADAPKVATYQDKIDAARQELITVPSDDLKEGTMAASMPVLDPTHYGYRPVAKESLVAVQDDVTKMEFKSTGNFGAVGGSVSIPIAKGVRFRVGGGNVKRHKEWQGTSHGRLLLTDKAFVFEGDQKNERITWGQVADIEFLTDGFQVAKRTGPPRTFAVSNPDPKFAAVLDLMLDRVG
ncbi:hypothetical protein [Ruegeria sp. AU67]|uniref:hypothetical protein n=1 Tax=Ruegeria sp. AU67 TaxID=2108530 RepID=UPI000D68BF09|nr:hypothetical protein [Ruegeria sp. AU67]